MRVLLLSIIAAFFILSGCTNGNASGQISYDGENLRTQLEEKSYQPMLPTEFPFEVEDASFSPTPTMDEEKVFNFNFIGENNSVELMTFNGESINLDMETEEVKVGAIDGDYAESEVNDKKTKVKRLVWKDEGVVYNLSTASTSKEAEISKEELIQIAESFK
ncbi:DUF4367 domain-containing protein [Halobacillus amylolyticus]|uniref:DUF4367 domain-containing protein n=1 Tax=Halobacillus amylolyticus TaxID=2932259 RepID=A0ABY4H976_9BACI|nr:DUF4367 domain-containing protein [Halobacillus amylolyticus]UOR10993.1 DUF4367 domain-containing protein [Halobacillus amylolyticus]